MIFLLGFSIVNIFRNKRLENELKHLALNFLLKSGKQGAWVLLIWLCHSYDRMCEDMIDHRSYMHNCCEIAS